MSLLVAGAGARVYTWRYNIVTAHMLMCGTERERNPQFRGA
jgi:hypothetical protein